MKIYHLMDDQLHIGFYILVSSLEARFICYCRYIAPIFVVYSCCFWMHLHLIVLALCCHQAGQTGIYVISLS
jgi:hypothetical protein